MAHSPVPGVEGFYTGLLHPVLTPDQSLALLALGVMLGQRFREWAGLTWLVFLASTFLGICLGQVGFVAEWQRPGLLSVAFLAAALSAIRPAGHFAQFVLLSGIGGLLIGLSSTPDPGPWRPTIITLVGSFTGANILLLYVGAGAYWLRTRFPRQWIQISLRVVAAWIAAISMIMAAVAISET